jgi:hypothetical protein
MSRRIVYKIKERPEYLVTEGEWDEIKRLQHWYNSEFTWSTGNLAFKRYILFPNVDEFSGLDTPIWDIIRERKTKLQEQGHSEYEIIGQLEQDRLVVLKWGGYFDDCLASGFTRVADNEWNSFLVCDFLLKASTLLPHVMIEIFDEGGFVRTKRLWLRDAVAMVPRKKRTTGIWERVIKENRFFASVDPKKYDKHPVFKDSIPGFNELEMEERRALVRNWNWLGFENSEGYDDSVPGMVNLNSKLRGFDFFD